MADFVIEPSDPAAPDAIPLLAALSETLAALTGSSGRQSFNNDDVRVAGSRFLLARDGRGKAVGCVACRPLTTEVAEIKRLFALAGSQGAGAALLRGIEDFARGYGYRQAWLEARRSNQRALEFYLRQGYQIIENYGGYVGDKEAVCFGREL